MTLLRFEKGDTHEKHASACHHGCDSGTCVDCERDRVEAAEIDRLARNDGWSGKPAKPEDDDPDVPF